MSELSLQSAIPLAIWMESEGVDGSKMTFDPPNLLLVD